VSNSRLLEALTCAMALAPGVYSRNRMFDFFAKAGIARAKCRAAVLRGIVRHLGHAHAVSLSPEDAVASGESGFVLRYQIPQMRLERLAFISRLELAVLRLLATRASATCLPADDADHALVEDALARLLVKNDTSDIALAASEVISPE